MARNQPLLIAGATGYGLWPENTREGAQRCMAAPFDGIEIDVQLTADGVVVAHHDYRLTADQTRLAGEWIVAPSPPIKTLTLAEVRRYDVGRSRPGSAVEARYPRREQMDGVAVPTLPELLDVLAAAEGPKRWIYVEIKTDPVASADAPEPELVVDAVLRDLDAASWLDRAKIIAFDWRVLRLARERVPAIETAHLTVWHTRRGDEHWALPAWFDGCEPSDCGGSDLVAVKAHGGVEWSPRYNDVTPERIAEAQELGLRVGPWGLSRAADIQRMADLGVFSATVSGAEAPA
ncbi:MAG TPA: glycerophosphodiester phosphodiesterase family protein [Caulobacteraceae bacterium]|nr:glycerophosphodiester phosphodiesterase family protein [Caulobacteraceae bacterium]